MLPLDDARWLSYLAGYRVPYDASLGLRRLFTNGPAEELWEEFWTELHHQGHVHQASYAAVPWLVEFVRRSPKIDWNALALIATIELERDQRWNPQVAKELAADYFAAIKSLPAVLGPTPMSSGVNWSFNPQWLASHWAVASGGLLVPTSSLIGTRLVGGSPRSSAGTSPTLNR